MTIKRTDSAFPSETITYPNGEMEYGAPGMSLRAYVATAALQGLLANPNIPIIQPAAYASDALIYADALIEELNKPTKSND